MSITVDLSGLESGDILKRTYSEDVVNGIRYYYLISIVTSRNEKGPCLVLQDLNASGKRISVVYPHELSEFEKVRCALKIEPQWTEELDPDLSKPLELMSIEEKLDLYKELESYYRDRGDLKAEEKARQNLGFNPAKW